MYRNSLSFDMPGRGLRDITAALASEVTHSGISTGLCHVFCRHTSASLVICENADPDVPEDMERFLARLVPDGDPLFRHAAEGPDDMPAHVRSMLTHTELTLPVDAGRLSLGTWQGVFLYEHRTAPHRREIIVSVWGE